MGLILTRLGIFVGISMIRAKHSTQIKTSFHACVVLDGFDNKIISSRVECVSLLQLAPE
jgi:hypothetical protein